MPKETFKQYVRFDKSMAGQTEKSLDENRLAVKSRAEKRQDVHEGLRGMIINGDCPPGSRLLQGELAKQLGTSVNSVREALYELRHLGLVEKREGMGFFVKKLTGNDFVEAGEMYALHQGFAARLCCRSISRNELNGLRQLAEQIMEHLNSDREENLREIALLDREFHDRIITLSGNRTLDRMRKAYWITIFIDVDVTSDKFKQLTRQAYEEHIAILKAIEENRPDDAESLMRIHYENVNKVLDREHPHLHHSPVKWHCRPIIIGDRPVMLMSFDYDGKEKSALISR